METEIQQIVALFSDAKSAYVAGGVFALASVLVKILVEVWSKWDWVQSFLPAKYQWVNLSTGKKRAIVICASLLATLLTGLASGLGLKAALLATIPGSIPVVLAALGIHSGSKKIGSVIDERAQAKIQSGSGEEKTRPDDMWEPTKFRRIMSPALPIDWTKYPKSKKILEAVEEMKAPRE